MSSLPEDPVVFACALDVRRETVYFLARIIHEHCESCSISNTTDPFPAATQREPTLRGMPP